MEAATKSGKTHDAFFTWSRLLEFGSTFSSSAHNKKIIKNGHLLEANDQARCRNKVIMTR